MRYFLLILILGVISITPSHAQWRQLLNEKTYSFAVNPKNPRTIFVGGKDGKFYRSYDAGTTWDTLKVVFQNGNPKLTNIFIHPIDTNIIIIGGIGFGSVRRSIDGGKTWSVSLERKFPMSMTSETIISDVNDPDVVYVGDFNSNLLFKSKDRGVTWDTISKIPGEHLCTITMVSNSTTMFSGSSSGVISKSTDNGTTWEINYLLQIFSTGDCEVPRIVFSKRNPLIGYAVSTYIDYHNRPNGGIFKTTDGGLSWNKIGFPDTSLWSLALRFNGSQEEIVVGGYSDELGLKERVYGQGVVQRSNNGGINWERIDQSISWTDTVYRNVWMMKFVNISSNLDRLHMATEKGFFVMDMPISVDEKVPESSTTDWRAKISGGKLKILPPENYDINKGFTIRLYSLIGQKIIDEKWTSDVEFSMDFCPFGVYSCEIITGSSYKQIPLISN